MKRTVMITNRSRMLLGVSWSDVLRRYNLTTGAAEAGEKY